MSKSTLTKFVVFCNRIIGETVPAKDFIDLEARMLKRQKTFWSSIQFKDEQNRTITIRRDWLEQGMSLQENIDDCIEYSTEEELAEEILSTDRFKKAA